MPGGITTPELRVVQYDLVICLFYRVSNLCIIMYKNGLVAAAVAAVAKAARKLCFRAPSARYPVEDWSTSPTRRSPRRCSARRTSKATR